MVFAEILRELKESGYHVSARLRDARCRDLGPAGCGAAVPVVQILGPQLELRQTELSGCHNISNSPDGCPYATNIGK